jgi:hypothetical protein
MKLQPRFFTAGAVMAAVFLAPSSRALVSLEDGREHIFIDASAEMAYDSNLFANAKNQGTLSYQGTLSTDIVRRAGWIGVNVTLSANWARYAKFSQQDYIDPTLTAELTKQTGRTTGSLTFGVSRVDHTDITANTRDTYLNYSLGLDVQYPVIERYSITGTFDYGQQDYTDRLLFTNLKTYTGNLFLYYVLNEQRDLFVNGRERWEFESNGDLNLDRAMSAGVSGRVFGPFNGSVQFGYQTRTPYGGPDHGNFDDFTASGTTTWNINRRMTLSGTLSRDFSTTSTAQSIENTSAGLTFQDSFTANASATLGANVGQNKFLGVEGDVAPDNGRRVDSYLSFNAGYFYTLNQHLKLSVNYTYYRSYSTLSFAEFAREGLTLGASSHW